MRRDRRARRAFASTVLVSLACSACGFATDDEDRPRWDRRVRAIAAEVQDQRGLTFDHPVPVTFLSDEDFEDEVAEDPSELDDDEQEDLEQFAGSLRALGLVVADTEELSESVQEVSAEGTLAFYDSEDERIVVRGERLDVEGRVTVAHELTHALQDQRFDLDRLFDEAEDESSEGVLTGLVEGDAIRIEDAYVDTLSGDEQDQYFEDSSDDYMEFQEGLSEDVPEVLPVLFAAPYDIGPVFVSVLELDGDDAVDDAFDRVPTTDEQLLDPSAYLDEEDAVAVDLPDLGADEEQVGDEETFGAVAWYYLLASRIDAATALGAVEGWGGDRFRQFERDGTTCVHIAFAGDTDAETGEMAAALDRWAAAMPPRAVSIERDPDQLTVTACDAGAAATPPPNSLFDAETVLGTREFTLLQVAPAVPSVEIAECAADRLATDPSLTRLLEETEPTDAQVSAFLDRVTEAVGRCRAG